LRRGSTLTGSASASTMDGRGIHGQRPLGSQNFNQQVQQPLNMGAIMPGAAVPHRQPQPIAQGNVQHHTANPRAHQQPNVQQRPNMVANVPNNPEVAGHQHQQQTGTPAAYAIHQQKPQVATATPPASESQEDPLPPGWKRALDKTSGKYYYYNKKENITTWEHPCPLIVDSVVPPPPPLPRYNHVLFSSLESKNRATFRRMVANFFDRSLSSRTCAGCLPIVLFDAQNSNRVLPCTACVA
jgi:hypothetical protein